MLSLVSQVQVEFNSHTVLSQFYASPVPAQGSKFYGSKFDAKKVHSTGNLSLATVDSMSITQLS